MGTHALELSTREHEGPAGPYNIIKDIMVKLLEILVIFNPAAIILDFFDAPCRHTYFRDCAARRGGEPRVIDLNYTRREAPSFNEPTSVTNKGTC